MKIRSMLLTTAFAVSSMGALALMPAAANAAAININIAAVGNDQMVKDETDMTARAVGHSNGDVRNNSAVTGDALNSVNLDSISVATDQTARGLNGQLVLVGNDQTVQEETDMTARAVAFGAGSVTDYSKVAASATNLLDTNVVTVTTNQR